MGRGQAVVALGALWSTQGERTGSGHEERTLGPQISESDRLRPDGFGVRSPGFKPRIHSPALTLEWLLPSLLSLDFLSCEMG